MLGSSITDYRQWHIHDFLLYLTAKLCDTEPKSYPRSAAVAAIREPGRAFLPAELKKTTLQEPGRHDKFSTGIRLPSRISAPAAKRNHRGRARNYALPLIKKLILRAFTAMSFAKGLDRGKALIAHRKKAFPEAMNFLKRDLEECLTVLKFPFAHRVKICTTNLLDRLFGEQAPDQSHH